MNYKVAFTRTATIVESCEVVVEATSRDEAVVAFEAGEFKRFLVNKRKYSEEENKYAKFSRVD